MPRPNDEVEALLREYADLLTLTSGDAFKARAYEKAARAVAGYGGDLSELGPQELRQIPGVGKSIADKIAEYFERGSITVVEEARARIPPGVRALTEIPTLGPKKAAVLYHDLGISSVDELVDAIQSERLRDLKGFGPKTEENLLHGVELLRTSGGRVLLDVATKLAEEITGRLSALPGVARCTHAGSLRRFRETIGDLDVLVAAESPVPVMAAFRELDLAAEVIASGDKKTSIRTRTGLQVDLRVVPPASWGAALQYFTGSQAHNVRVRERAVRAGLKLSEYGLFDVETGELIVSETEEEVYARLGLPWIPPPLREDRGELEAALRGELPDLVRTQDLRGDLHTHTDLTDGVASLEEMLAAAAARGYEYYAVTDHAPNLVIQRMTDEKMLAQRERVRALDRTYGGMRVLHGTELNIDADGGVDWPAEFLAGFDLCVASVHSAFTQSRADTTRRLVRAAENPHVHVLGHLTGRQIGHRPPIDADFAEVFRACARTGTALEVNSFADRLDVRDEHIRQAREYGVKFAIDSDAHSVRDLAQIRYGVGTAQRGWLTADEVINTWPLGRLRKFLEKPSAREA
ncbi:DNA polymerase (family 10) [Amycolatopsis bartoniae]|uniref:DNA polymerase beta n=1 Tax=Amycolatopsis bartoniae TaxID=941986 RepID=A0A8H9MBA8_9PSEU|nr:DNA polymerase/3'-5' exonuclease PolX [Amycolatopsis bartoniae]MBB2938299.1 DNA polymerase (family 10) [Amycolatopsis bartoniae]TVT09065.1 DNA polymerase/3'-5' exonuclease PolX [Amycolatopsis bartoniae]GHF34140.1 DNA polymerase/3'-5' exonuclease PolX [Amycolatopsis bartoniae]